ncbi:amidohydrolase family protein [Hymenobacter sp. PAMC 26628]|uniref:amidohydrolase family protein n=1 Tax=Hymenobacter sp. PAMC 26628 TaxID=1484118 RepID=UPI00076FE4F0|nr:amidohydrolase family protein [Hymenobacter sp. PAMC 26628]AMJ66028.1 hypothetical protein AXW84_11740 [Hymenobacter sp. PAMC 26628]
MKIIGLEEHFWTPELADALTSLPPEQQDDVLKGYPQDFKDKLADLGEGRLRHMDLIGLDMMVLSVSSPGAQGLPPAQAVALARQANDRLAAAVKAHPDRFAGFATLPTPDPAAAVRELERAVQELGFKGALINGRTGDKYLDHPDFRPLLAKAAELDVPIYLHPQIAPKPVRALYYDGFDPELSIAFASSGWGWHLDAGIGALRLILSGVFDELPSLQFILGHWGEMVTFYLDRANDMSARLAQAGRKKSVAEYFRQNFYLTSSGLFVTPYLQRALNVMGADRVMFSSDYPFRYFPDGTARSFLEQAPISFDDKAKIGHLNAERLLKLK